MPRAQKSRGYVILIVYSKDPNRSDRLTFFFGSVPVFVRFGSGFLDRSCPSESIQHRRFTSHYWCSCVLFWRLISTCIQPKHRWKSYTFGNWRRNLILQLLSRFLTIYNPPQNINMADTIMKDNQVQGFRNRERWNDWSLTDTAGSTLLLQPGRNVFDHSYRIIVIVFGAIYPLEIEHASFRGLIYLVQWDSAKSWTCPKSQPLIKGHYKSCLRANIR
jgi:hypothetical protein